MVIRRGCLGGLARPCGAALIPAEGCGDAVPKRCFGRAVHDRGRDASVDDREQPSGDVHTRTEPKPAPHCVSAVQGPVSAGVAGEGFEPSKAKPTDLQ